MNTLKKLILFVISLFLVSISLNSSIIAQRPADNFERRVHYFADDSIQYRLFIPNDSANFKSISLNFNCSWIG